MRPYSLVYFGTMYACTVCIRAIILFVRLLTFLLVSFFLFIVLFIYFLYLVLTFQNRLSFCFQAGGRSRRPNLVLGCLALFYVIVQ